MNRKKEREFAFQSLFAWQFENKDIGQLINDTRNAQNSKHKGDFAKKILNYVSENIEATDETIKKFINNWEFSRVAVVDLTLIRLAICEFLYFSDIPPEVTMNEVIELGKKYGSENTSKFVNGVLDSILEYMINTKQLNKSEKGSLRKKRR